MLHVIDRVAFAILGASQRGPIVDHVVLSSLKATFGGGSQQADPKHYESTESILLALMNARSADYGAMQDARDPLKVPGYVSGWIMYSCAMNMTAVADPQAAKDPLVTIPLIVNIGLILTILNVQEAIGRAKDGALLPVQ